MLTPIGFIIIPVSLLMFLLAPDYLLPWAVAVSVLQAASVFNVGGTFPLGVTPYFFVTILIGIRFVPLWMSGQLGFGGDEHVCTFLKPLLLLIIWASLSAFLLPVLFAGTPVDSPRSGSIDSGITTPLYWSWSNLAQAGYLVLDGVFVLYTAWQSADRTQINRCFAAFRWSGAFAVAVGLYQFLAHATGLPFPSSFFNSNPAWAQLTDQNIGGAWRVSATFTEASGAGAYFSMWTTMLLFSSLDNDSSRSEWLLLGCGVAMIAMTTSTTGYIVGSIVLLLFFGKHFSHILLHGVIARRALFAIAILITALGLGLVMLPHAREVIREAVWNKAQSGSGVHRTATSARAIVLAADTFGLGAGLGSSRPSGMLFYIVGNLGIPGLLLFVYLIYLTRVLTKAASHTVDGSLAALVRACGWSFAIILLAMAASGAEFTAPVLWVIWGILLGGCRFASLHQAAEHVPSDPLLLVDEIPSLEAILLIDAVA